MVRSDKEADEGAQSRCCVHYTWCVYILLLLLSDCSPALWEYQKVHDGKLPVERDAAPELLSIANSMLAEADVNRQALSAMPAELIEYQFPLMKQ